MGLRITYTSTFRKGTSEEFEDTPLVRLGRHPDNDCVFNSGEDLGVSGFHAEIRTAENAPVIRDLNSSNGLYVNGHRVKDANLKPNDLVELGPGGPALQVEYVQKQYGEKTVGMMIQQALMQAGFKGTLKSTKYLEALVEKTIRRSTSDQKRLVILGMVVFVVVGLSVAYYAGYRLQEKELSHSPSMLHEKSPDETIAHTNRSAIFMIVGRQKEKPEPSGKLKGFCTAFAIAPDLLATNAHCIKSAKTKYSDVLVIMNGNPSLRYRINRMLTHPEYHRDRFSPDVGLVSIGGRLKNTVKLASDEVLARLAPGAPVFLYGFPGRLNRVDAPEATFVKGNIGRITTFKLTLGSFQENHLVQHSAFSSSGTSGSPIFNESGHAIAINAGGYTENGRTLTGYNFGVRIDMIQPLIKKMRGN